MAGLEQGSPSEFMKTIVVKPHIATDESQLELKVNDIVYVLEQDHTGWWGGHKEGEDCTGWFPGSCVRPVQLEQLQPSVVAQSPCNESHSRHCTDTAALKPSSNVSCAAQPGSEASALHTEMKSPLRQKSLVASPQRRDCFQGSEIPHEGGVTARNAVVVATADGQTTEPIPSNATEAINLTAENAKLRQEVSQMNEALELLRKQFDVDRQGFLEMEMVAEQERQQRQLVEQKLLTETSEQSRISNETASLRQQLEREQQKSEVQSKSLDDMQKLHENQMQAKDSDLRMASEHLEHNRKLLQSEKHQVRLLEEQLQQCRNERRLLEEQLQQCRNELELQRQSHWRNHLMPAVATVAIDARPSPGAADPQEPFSFAEETRRRLFPSIVDDQVHVRATPLSTATPHGVSPQFVQECRKFQNPSPRSGTDAARGRTLNSARTVSRTAPWVNFSPSISGGAVRHDPERPFEQQRSASSAPHFGGRTGFSDWRPGLSRSAGDLKRSASNTGSYVSMAKRDEAPPPGCVADRVTMFEQRCQTPRRGLYRADTLESCSGRSSREDVSRATPPTLPRALQRSVPMHSEAPPAGQENCQDSQIFLGMSPIGKCHSDESFAALSSLKAAQVHSSASTFTLKCSEGYSHLSDPVPQHGRQASGQPHNGRESSVPEVPVHERIRQLEDR